MADIRRKTAFLGANTDSFGHNLQEFIARKQHKHGMMYPEFET